ncbi:MAG: hypothetical protein Q8R67_16465 [Rhodoferax sp.]|nr:hypothetical protein [Rhodoferax sp.]MDP3653269.1 hypothetical protein [Rhodoferax sp.]
MKLSKNIVLTAAALCVAGAVGLSYSQSGGDPAAGNNGSSNPSANSPTYPGSTANTPSDSTTGGSEMGSERVARVDRN